MEYFLRVTKFVILIKIVTLDSGFSIKFKTSSKGYRFIHQPY